MYFAVALGLFHECTPFYSLSATYGMTLLLSTGTQKSVARNHAFDNLNLFRFL